MNWGPLGLIRHFTSVLVKRSEDKREEESQARYIPIDAPVPLRYDNPVATLGKGEIFGEMTCMSSYPRSATVRAEEDCTVLEILRNVLYILQRNKASRARLDETYRARAIDNHLRSVPIFASLLGDEAQFKEFVDYLRPRVELLRIKPGEVIFRQGDPADAFYLVRIGFVKVAQSRPGGELVLTYHGAGQLFRRDRPAVASARAARHGAGGRAHRDLHCPGSRGSGADQGGGLPAHPGTFPRSAANTS